MDETMLIPEVPQEEPAIPAEPAPPIESRFLFVDVAALRAKQLRRGARVRFDGEEVPLVHKAERLAMEEVRRGLVHYDVPDPTLRRSEDQVFVLALFIGFCVIFGFTKLKRTSGTAGTMVIKSLDETISHQPMRYLAPTAPRGPADQLHSPELLEAARLKT
jgi:DNA-directed RNA polymerase subunit K/omega